MPDIAAPQAGATVDQRATAFVIIIHALGARDDARIGLEGAVLREGKPEGGKIVGLTHDILTSPRRRGAVGSYQSGGGRPTTKKATAPAMSRRGRSRFRL